MNYLIIFAWYASIAAAFMLGYQKGCDVKQSNPETREPA